MHTSNYLPAVDGLRTVAIALVFLGHTYYRYFPGGFVGVDIFFAISGFLITRILLKETDRAGRPSLIGFYSRRALRILPALVVCVVLTALLLPSKLTGPSDTPLQNVSAALLGYMNWLRALTPATGGALVHTWSLGVEEQFYAVWIFAVLACAQFRNARSAVLTLAILGGIAIAGWRLYLFATGAPIVRIYNGLDTRGDALLVGCALAALSEVQLARLRPLARLWLVPVVVLLAALLTIQWYSWILPAGGYTVVAASSGWLVYLAAYGGPGFVAGLGNRLAMWMGKRSYSFYLWHVPILAAVPMTGLSRHLGFLLAFALTVLIAHLSYQFVELPFLRRKARMSAHA